MGRYIKPSLIIFIAFLIVGSCNGSGSSNTTTRTIGPEGGTIRSADGRLTLIIPAGALDEDTEITIRRINPEDLPPEYDGIDTDRQYELEPAGLEFNIPITAETSFEGGTVDENGDIAADFIFLLTSLNGELEILDDLETEVNVDDKSIIVRGALDHFTPIVRTLLGGLLKITIKNIPDTIPVDVEFTIEVSIDIDQDNIINFEIREGDLLHTDDSIPKIRVLSDSNLSFTSFGQNLFKTLEVRYVCIAGPSGIYASEIGFAYFFNLPGKEIDRKIGRTVFSRGIICTGGEEPTPPPPPPTPMPTPQPTPEPTCAETAEGEYDLNCDTGQDPTGIIMGNLGGPNFTLNDVIISQNDPDDGIMITTLDNKFTTNGTINKSEEGICIANTTGSGMLGDPFGANITVKTEGILISESPEGIIILEGGTWRFNFQDPGFQGDNQSSTAECVGEKK